ncbi:hypothetical protein AnigIFM60653_010026 [Aspergillus niger]|nr:hypothetical protein AnigIFM60653_010026 [Aspergillus niger]
MPKLNLFGTGFVLQAAIWAACGMAFILFGYDQGVFSGIVENDDFLDTMNHPNDSLEGIIVSIYNLGCFAGCIVNFLLGDWLGRRRAMWFAMVWVIIGATLQCSAFSVPHLMVGRFVTGIGTGVETSTVPMYQAELCEASKRGKLVVIVLVLGLPESPRYCYKEGRNEEALQILSDVYGRPKDDPKILAEQEEILEAISVETKYGEYKWRWVLINMIAILMHADEIRNVFKRDEVSTGHRVLLAYGMQFMNQMGGINMVVYYIPTVLNTNVGLDKNLSNLLGGCVQIMFVVGSIFPTFFVDRVGRRAPMIWGSFGLGICMMMVSILLSFKGHANEHATSSAAVAFFFVYMLIFGASVNCIPWCYVPEILPLHARAKGTAVGISSNWIWNFFVVMITPIIINRLQWKAYLIFMCLNFAFVPLIYFCYPETAKLTLEEIDYLFTTPGKNAVQMSKELVKQRKQHGHVPGQRLTRHTDEADSEKLEKKQDSVVAGVSDEQVEQV